MECSFSFHGTPKLNEVIQSGMIVCPSLQLGSEMYEHHSSKYESLVQLFAERFRHAVESGKAAPEHERLLNNTDQKDTTLADIVVTMPYYFSTSGEEAHDYKELRRGVHVFLAQYGCAMNYASGPDRAVIEMLLPDFIVDRQILGGWTLVRKEIELERATGIFVPRTRMPSIRRRLERKGYAIQVKRLQ